jgi:hypothetical protein
VRVLTPTEAAYLAGIVDGEGTIHIGSGVRTVRVSVVNTDATLIEWLRQIGGTVIVNRRHFHDSRKSTKVVFSWSVNSWRNSHDVLTQIAPYMLIKRSKAKAAVAALAEWLNGPKRVRRISVAQSQ